MFARTRFLTALSLTFVSLHTASAQIEKGDSQITLQGSITSQINPNGNGPATGSLGGVYGYFITRQIALRANAFLAVTGGSQDSGSQVLGVYGAGMELNLGGAGQKFVPYLALDVSTMSGMEGTESSTMIGPAAGARAFVTRNTAFDVSVRYETQTGNTDYGTIRTNFGFAVFFGKQRR